MTGCGASAIMLSRNRDAEWRDALVERRLCINSF